MRKARNKALTTIEYAVLISIVVFALLAMRVYMQRGIQQKYREAADVFGQGEQYERGVTMPRDEDGDTSWYGDSPFNDDTIAPPSDATCDQIRAYVDRLARQVETIRSQMEGVRSTIAELEATMRGEQERNPVAIMDQAIADLRERQRLVSDQLNDLVSVKSRLETDIATFENVHRILTGWIFILGTGAIPRSEVEDTREILEARRGATNNAISMLNADLRDLDSAMGVYRDRILALREEAQALRAEAARFRAEGREFDAKARETSADARIKEATDIQEMIDDELSPRITLLTKHRDMLNKQLTDDHAPDLNDMISQFRHWESQYTLWNPYYQIPIVEIEAMQRDLMRERHDRIDIIGDGTGGMWTYNEALNKDISNLRWELWVLDGQIDKLGETRDDLAEQLADNENQEAMAEAIAAMNNQLAELEKRAAEIQASIDGYQKQYQTCFSGA